jgi:hypothetical protein
MSQLVSSVPAPPGLIPRLDRPHDGRRRPLSGERFQATVGRFDDLGHQRTMDELTRWVEATYRDDLAKRPSKHVYVRTLPPEVVARIDELRNSEVIGQAILRQFDRTSRITPMAHTDELYVSHYNKDGGGDQGLFDKHYDGNLGFLRAVSVVRALIYLQSDAAYTVVFADSGVKKAFTSYEFGLLDFHRELHWVEGEYVPGGPQRILLKCNYLVAPANAGWAVRLAMAANTGVFYVVKAAMEYSKSPTTPSQRLVGMVCNAARELNNVHPALPLAALAAVAIAAGWGLAALLV